MLTNKALHEETEKMNALIEEAQLEKKNPIEAAKIKAFTLILKMLHSIRTNQVAIMEKIGAKKLEPPVRKEDGISNQ